MAKHEYIVGRYRSPHLICRSCYEEIRDDYCYEFGDFMYYCPKCFRDKYYEDWMSQCCDACEKVTNDAYVFEDEVLCPDCCDESYRRGIILT